MTPSALDVERATLTSWPPRELEDLHGWRLCAASGVTGRVNACWPLEWRSDDINADIDAVEAWYRARNLQPRFKLTDGATDPADLADHLARRGYAMVMDTLIMLTSLSAEPSAHEGVTLFPAMPPLFDQALRDSTPSAEDLDERRAIALRAPAPAAFAVRESGGVAQAVGMSACAGSLAGIFLMRTVPAARRHGHARHILRALLEWAAANGAGHAFLQVDSDNVPAIALYEREGFTKLTGYRFWKKA